MPIAAGSYPYPGAPTRPTGEITPPEVPGTVYQRIEARPEMFGEQVGHSMSALGGVLAKSADEFERLTLERQNLHNQVVADDQTNNWSDGAIKKETEYRLLQGKDAVKAYPELEAGLIASRNQMRGQLTNQYQQLEFDRNTRRELQGIMFRAGSWYDQQHAVFQDETNKAGATLARQKMYMAASSGDSVGFDNAVREAMEFEYQELQAKGLAGDTNSIYAMQGRIRGDATAIQVEALGVKNPVAARTLLDQNKGIIPQAQYDRLDGQLRSRAIHAQAFADVFGPGQAAGGGQFTAPPGPRPFSTPIEGATPAEQQMGNEVRYRESRGNYTAPPNEAGASGAYQYKPQTWQEDSKAAGIGTEFSEAYKAPPKVQDAVFLWTLRNHGLAPWAASGPYPALGGSRGIAGPGVPEGTIDKTQEAGFGTKFGPLQSPQGMIIHHTSGGGTVDSVISTMKERGYPAQFVIDRQGKIYQTLPDGYQGQHIRDSYGPLGAGKTNANMEGVEIIANNDGDVLPVQQEAAARLVAARAQKWGYDPRTSVFGHGEVNPGHKEADEGMSTVTRIRNGSLAVPIPPGTTAVAPAELPGMAAGIKRIVEGPGDPDQKAADIQLYETQYRALQTDQERMRQQNLQAIKSEDERTRDQFYRGLFPQGDPVNAPQVTASDIANAPLMTDQTGPIKGGLTAETKQTLIGFVERSTKPDPLSKISQQTTTQLLEDIRRPADDPQRINDMGPIYNAFIQSKLNRGDFDFLQKQFTDTRSPEGERLATTQKDFFAGMRPLITKSNPLMGAGDQIGDPNFYMYQQWVQGKIDQYRKDGKDPFDLFNPSKPDYVGSPAAIRPFQTTFQTSIQSKARGISETPVPPPWPLGAPPPTAGPPAVPRQPGESVQDYLKRTGAAPPPAAAPAQPAGPSATAPILPPVTLAPALAPPIR